MVRLGRIRRIRRDQAGAAAMEFALVTPALVLLIVGIAQLGILFMANAGLRNAVAEGARYATIYDVATGGRPTNAQIRDRITNSEFGLNPANMTTPSVTPCTSDGANCVDISVSYSVPMDFIFFSLPSVTLTETRRAFVPTA
jgi:Flp pilus assembly protein TadG